MNKKHKVIRGNSLFELSISERYLGEIINKPKNPVDLTRLEILEDENSGIFLDSQDGVITATSIEGLVFQAGAQTIPGTDKFKPILQGRGTENRDPGVPRFDFIVTPPDARKMYVFMRYTKKMLSEMVIAIAIRYKNDDELVLHRPPIPNCNFPNGTICLGNALDNTDKQFNPSNTSKVISKTLTGGWNADWFRNQVFFVEKNGEMRIRWHKPMQHIEECCYIDNPLLRSIAKIMETTGKTPIKLDRLRPDLAQPLETRTVPTNTVLQPEIEPVNT